ncbi:MAG: SH3-like domain-containing protein [Pseudomonadota bacterium]
MGEPDLTERVRVKTLGTHGLHVRAPAYMRGKVGVIERRIRPFPNPEKLAYRLPAEERLLLRVRFTMAELWGGDAERPDDTVDVEIYEHWLEPADAP